MEERGTPQVWLPLLGGIDRKGLPSFFLATLIGLSSLSFKELLMPDIAHEWTDRTVAIYRTYVSNKAKTSTILDGESILLNLSTGWYSTLNAVGSVIWDLSTGHHSLDSVVSAICAKFDVTARQAKDDLIHCLSSLVRKGLFILKGFSVLDTAISQTTIRSFA